MFIFNKESQKNYRTAVIKFLMKSSGDLSFKVYPYLADIITKTCLYNFDPLKPHFYTAKLGFTGVDIIFLIFA